MILTPGANLARVADPKRLKAEIKIAETQAKDVTIGQAASIDTRNGIIKGVVSRIDPSVQNGTVSVDIQIVDPLPLGARPDLSVDGPRLAATLDGLRRTRKLTATRAPAGLLPHRRPAAQ